MNSTSPPPRKSAKRSTIFPKLRRGPVSIPRKDSKGEIYKQQLINQFIIRRKELGWSQDLLEQKLGIADRLLSKWESGERSAGLYMIYLWADCLDADLILQPRENNNDG